MANVDAGGVQADQVVDFGAGQPPLPLELGRSLIRACLPGEDAGQDLDGSTEVVPGVRKPSLIVHHKTAGQRACGSLATEAPQGHGSAKHLAAGHRSRPRSSLSMREVRLRGSIRLREEVGPACQPKPLLLRVHNMQIRSRSRDLSDDVAPEDFEIFFRREHPRLLTLAVALIGDREVARELVQESLLRAFNSWPKVARLERPGGWTRRVLVNLCVDLHRRRGRERRALERSVPALASESPDLPSAMFWESVRRLPRLQRSVVAMHYVDDMSVMEVAEVLGVSSGSVKTSLSRARASLAPALIAHVRGEMDQ